MHPLADRASACNWTCASLLFASSGTTYRTRTWSHRVGFRSALDSTCTLGIPSEVHLRFWIACMSIRSLLEVYHGPYLEFCLWKKTTFAHTVQVFDRILTAIALPEIMASPESNINFQLPYWIPKVTAFLKITAHPKVGPCVDYHANTIKSHTQYYRSMYNAISKTNVKSN